MAANNDTPAESGPEPTREELLRTIAELRKENRDWRRAVVTLFAKYDPIPDDFDAEAALRDADTTSIPEILEELEREYGSVQSAPVQSHPLGEGRPRDQAAG